MIINSKTDLTSIAKESGGEISYIEDHIHGKSRWLGKKAVQSATEWAVPLDTGLTLLYRAISGAGVYGADANDESQIVGSADVILAGAVKFDVHEIQFPANSSSTLYLCRLIWGIGTMAAAITAGQYTEFPYFRKNDDTVRKVATIMCPKITAGTKVWLQTMNATDNATLDFVVGVHTYNF
jgi:hypothetical protein